MQAAISFPLSPICRRIQPTTNTIITRRIMDRLIVATRTTPVASIQAVVIAGVVTISCSVASVPQNLPFAIQVTSCIFPASAAPETEQSIQENTMASANDLRKGMAINYNGDISVVLETQHRTPGNLRAFVQATLRSIRTGKASDVRFSSTEKMEVIPMMTKRMEYSYKDGEDFVFSDPETYKTVTLTSEIVGDSMNYLVENGSVTDDDRRR